MYMYVYMIYICTYISIYIHAFPFGIENWDSLKIQSLNYHFSSIPIFNKK